MLSGCCCAPSAPAVEPEFLRGDNCDNTRLNEPDAPASNEPVLAARASGCGAALLEPDSADWALCKAGSNTRAVAEPAAPAPAMSPLPGAGFPCGAGAAAADVGVAVAGAAPEPETEPGATGVVAEPIKRLFRGPSCTSCTVLAAPAPEPEPGGTGAVDEPIKRLFRGPSCTSCTVLAAPAPEPEPGGTGAVDEPAAGILGGA